MLSSNPVDFKPKASVRVIEIWANSSARKAAVLSDVQAFAMPTEPLKALQEMQGGRWESFHQGSQDFQYRHTPGGIVAATDGSISLGEDGIPLMGGGIAFQGSTHRLQDVCVHTWGHVSSLVAEGGAAQALLCRVDKATPLTILTDSANVMFAMQNCSRREEWRDFTHHPEAELLGALAKLQATRTAPTHWVKIKSHTSVYLNEKADYLATHAYSDPEAVINSFEPQTDANALKFYKQGEEEDVQVKGEELLKHFVQLRQDRVLKDSLRKQHNSQPKHTRTVQKLTSPNVGRYLLHTVLWSLTGQYSLEGRVAKRMLQCITNTFPTQSRLAQMQIVGSADCPFCTCNRESLFHWQQECTQFGDARTKVHDNIWTAVLQAIGRGLPKEVEAYKEVVIGDTNLRTNGPLDSRKPDCIFYNTVTSQYIMVDYTRSWGSTREELAQAETLKRASYDPLIAAIRAANPTRSVKFYPLVSSYNCAIAEDTWQACMTELEITDKDQNTVLLTAAKAICIGFSTMADIRISALNNTRAGDRVNSQTTQNTQPPPDD